MRNPFGPLRFRVPLAAPDRAAIIAPSAASGDVIAGWPREALAITGNWPAPMLAPTIRPVFPGALRFIAANPAEIPTEAQIDVENGQVTNACLDRLSLTGNVLVRVQGAAQLAERRRHPGRPAFKRHLAIRSPS